MRAGTDAPIVAFGELADDRGQGEQRLVDVAPFLEPDPFRAGVSDALRPGKVHQILTEGRRRGGLRVEWFE